MIWSTACGSVNPLFGSCSLARVSFATTKIFEGCEVPPYEIAARDKEYIWAEP